MKKIISITLSLLLLSCSKVTTVQEILVDRDNTWGIEFKSTPIDQASQEEINAGSAIAYIKYIDGGSATGFFISSDGLFMTNSHVISKKICSADRCNGITLTREMKYGGAQKVYSDITLLASNSELDYAIVQVNLDANEKVPFLKLEQYDRISNRNKDQFKLRILGHPFGGLLRAQNAVYDKNYSRDRNVYQLKSTAISGNSGSPLFDVNTETVLGLYHSARWDKRTVEMNGNVKHFGYASNIPAIIKNIESYYDVYQTDTEGIELVIMGESSDILPKPFSEIEVTKHNWIYISGNEEEFETNFNIVMKKELDIYNSQSYKKKTTLKGILYSLLDVSKSRGYSIDIKPEYLEIAGSTFFTLKSPLSILSLKKSSNSCVETLNKRYETDFTGKTSIKYLDDLGYYCLKSTTFYGGLIADLIKHYNWYKKDSTIMTKREIRTYLRILNVQMSLSNKEIGLKKVKLIKILESFTSQIKTWSSKMKLEKLIYDIAVF